MNWLTDFFTRQTSKPTGWVNQTNIEHAVAALMMQLIIGFTTGDWFAGACFGFAFFLGREHAQFQDTLGYNFKTTFQAFDIRKWSLDARLDLLFPTVTVLIVLAIASFVQKGWAV